MRPYIVALVGLMVACNRGEESDLGPTCEGTPVVVALDEVTPIGLTAGDLIARIPAHQDAEFTYADGTTTPLALDFTVGAEATFTDLEAVYPEGNSIDIGVICDDAISVPVDLTFATADGVFDEAISTPATATTEDLGSLNKELDLAAMGGTFVIDDYTDVTDYTDARLFISVALHDDAVTTGAVNGDVSGEDPCDGDTCSAWDAAVDVGLWGAPTEP